jgi:hypothetical protein
MNRLTPLLVVLFFASSCKPAEGRVFVDQGRGEDNGNSTSTPIPDAIKTETAGTPEIPIHPLLRITPKTPTFTPTPLSEMGQEFRSGINATATARSTPRINSSHSGGTGSSIQLQTRNPTLSELSEAMVASRGEYARPSSDAKILYIDLNGDREEDLVLYDNALSYAFLWNAARYVGPFDLNEEYGFNSDTQTQLSFEDVTFDGIPEIVFDVLELYPWGTGLFSASWYRTYSHCNDLTCSVVLRIPLGSYTIDDNFGGTCVERDKLSLAPAEASLRHFSEGFSIFGCGFWPGADQDIPKLRISESLVTYYKWDGTAFVSSRTETARLASTVTDRSLLTSVSNRGVVAQVVPKPNNFGGEKVNDYCQLYISGAAVGSHFGCKRNFSRVEWIDLTGDGTQEVVAISYSGASAYDLEGDIGSLSCGHQHLLAYAMETDGPALIADLTGCTFRSDLVGVELRDLDGNGTLEILAAEDPLHNYWLNLGNSSRWNCEQGEIEEVNSSTFRSCGYFDFDPQFIVYGWNGQTYFPQ